MEDYNGVVLSAVKVEEGMPQNAGKRKGSPETACKKARRRSRCQ